MNETIEIKNIKASDLGIRLKPREATLMFLENPEVDAKSFKGNWYKLDIMMYKARTKPSKLQQYFLNKILNIQFIEGRAE